MTLDRRHWSKIYFKKNHFPSLLCPSCASAHLKIERDLIALETSKTQLYKRDENFTEWDYSQKFVIILKCENVSCNEIVICAGTAYNEVDGVSELEDYGDFQNISLHYIPEYFTPPLNIIPLNDKYPEIINRALNDSFKVFFVDRESCANKIRIVVERLLDLFSIPKSKKNNAKKLKRLTLHQRIEEYQKRKSFEIGELLLSVKWIGNYGSHNDTLTIEDLLDAYSILERALSLLYDESITTLSRIINKKKRPISRIKRTKK